MPSSSHRFRLALFFLLLIIVTCAVVARAQKGSKGAAVPPPPPPDFSKLPDTAHIQYQEYDKKPLVFTSTPINVLVPAVVTDKDGNHVSGLTKEAFRVQENGKDQVLVSVEEIKPITTPVPVPVTAANVFTNTPANPEMAPRRLVILVVDLVNTPFLDQALARQAVISYLADNMEPDALYQLVAIDMNGLRVVHEFTQDTPALLTALKNVKGRLISGDKTLAEVAMSPDMKISASQAAPGTGGGVTISAPNKAVSDPGPASSSIALDPDEVMLALLAKAEGPLLEMQTAERAAATLLAFQQIAQRVSGIAGRKSLVWITGGFPFSIDPETASVDVSMSFAAYQHTMHLLANQMISVYPVDARGLLSNQPDAAMRMNARRTMTAGNWITDVSVAQSDVLGTMRTFADLTGGRAFVNSNDTRGAIRRAARDGAAYYLLSYAVDKSDRRPGWRRIKVKAANYTVRARPGYFMTQATADPALLAQMDIDTALTSPFDYTGLPMRVALEPASVAGDKRKMSFAMTMPPKAAQVDSADKNHLNVVIAYSVQGGEGRDAGHKGTSYNLHLNAAQLQQIESQGVGFSDTLELAPGEYDLRVVVRDNLTGRMGSVKAHLQLK